MTKAKQFTLLISDSLKARLQKQADKREMQLSTYIRYVLIDYLVELEHAQEAKNASE